MYRKTPIALLATLMLAAILFAGCHEPEDRAIPGFTYEATDFAFDGPDELPAGWVQLTLENGGQQAHHIQLFRLTDGKSGADYRAAIAAGEAHPDWIEAVGGPNTPGPGGSSVATVFLEAGDYVMVCEIPDPQGVPHLKHGMVKDVRVDEGDAADEPPEADLTVSLHDFSFDMKEDWTTGAHTVEVVNEGGQPHELVLVRYHEGGNLSRLLEAFGPNATGPPPADFLGGISGIGAGDTQFFPADLATGTYGFICFLADPGSGAPHFALGMEQEFQVS